MYYIENNFRIRQSYAKVIKFDQILSIPFNETETKKKSITQYRIIKFEVLIKTLRNPLPLKQSNLAISNSCGF